MALVLRWRRGVLLAALAALLSMHGVGAGHDATGSMSMSMSMSTSLSTAVHAVDVTSSPAVTSLPPSSPLLATTCLALLALGVVLCRLRGARLRTARTPGSSTARTLRRSQHWPRGPDPVLDLCTSRT